MSEIVEKLKDLLADNIIGRHGIKVFKDRISQEFPDYEFIENVEVKNDKPYMAIVATSQSYNEMYRLEKTEDVQTISDIAHEGSSQASCSLSGDHIGNNDYVIEITTSGPLGSAEYKLSKDGGETYGETAIISAGGQVAIGDGTVLTFGEEGILIAGDKYSWQSVSMKEFLYQTDVFTIALSIQIYTANKMELFGEGEFIGYLNQVRNLFSVRRAIHDDEFIYRVNLDKRIQPYSDYRANKFRGLLSVIIEGSLYYKQQIPLIGMVIEEVA